MRIKRFSEARGIFEEEFSLEPQIHCFGGPGGGGGGGGGGSDRGGGYDEDNFADDSGFTEGFGGGGAGDRATDSASERATGVSRGGGGGNDRSPAVNPGNIGVGSGASLGATSNLNFSARGAGGPNIGGGRDSSMIDSYLDGPMMADISTPMTGGSFVDPTTGRGIMSDIPSMDYGSMAAGANVADPSFDQGSLLGQVSSDGSVFDYSTDDIFGEPTPEQVAQQQYVSGLQAGAPSPAEEIIQFARSIAPQPSVTPTESTRDEQAIQDVQDRNAVRGATDIATGIQTGTMARDTTITPSNLDNPFGDSIFDSDAARSADLADLQARGNMTASQLAAAARGTPAEQVTSQARTPAADIDITYDRTGINQMRDILGVNQNIPQMSFAPEDPVSQYLRQDSFGKPAGPMSLSPVGGGMMESGIDRARLGEDVLDARAIDEAIFEDPSSMPLMTVRAGMELVNSLESTFGGNQARKMVDVANRPGGSFVRDPASGEVLGAVGPEENIRSAFMGAQDAVYVGDPRGYEQGVAVGTSILGPDTNVRDFGTQDPFTGQLEGRPGADYSTPVITESRDGDGGQRLLPPPVPPEAVTTPEEYQGRNIVGEPRGYRPRGPINYAYTGLPSLAPVALRPSFRARGQYSPLFPVG